MRFYVSVVDLDAGSSIAVDGETIAIITETPAQAEIVASVGGKLTVHSPTGMVQKSWVVPFGIRQLMVNKAILGIDDNNDDKHGCTHAMPTCSMSD